MKTDQPMEPDKFVRWIEDVTQRFGVDILRMKGIIAMKDDDERFVITGVHMLIEGGHQRPWKPGRKHAKAVSFSSAAAFRGIF